MCVCVFGKQYRKLRDFCQNWVLKTKISQSMKEGGKVSWPRIAVLEGNQVTLCGKEEGG